MSDPSDMKYILQEFKGHYLKAVETTLDASPYPDVNLRVSSFPYCGLRHAFRKMIQAPATVGFGAMYYTQVGTIFHALIQQWIGLRGRLYGHWKCNAPECGGRRKFSNLHRCPKCDAPMEYVEVTVKAFGNVSGHIDGIYRSEDGRYWIVDYKTSSVYAINEHKKKPAFPYMANRAQIKGYVTLAEMRLGIEISGWILFYISRDSPMATFEAVGEVVSTKAKEKYRRLIRKWSGQYTLVQNVRKLSDLTPLIEGKPCADREFYDKYYSGYETCPLAKGDVCFEEKPLKRYLKKVWYESGPGLK